MRRRPRRSQLVRPKHAGTHEPLRRRVSRARSVAASMMLLLLRSEPQAPADQRVTYVTVATVVPKQYNSCLATPTDSAEWLGGAS